MLPDTTDHDISGMYSSNADWGAQFKASTDLQEFSSNNPNGLTRKQEIMVRSAIKYWVERHKHVVRYVHSGIVAHAKFVNISTPIISQLVPIDFRAFRRFHPPFAIGIHNVKRSVRLSTRI